MAELKTAIRNNMINPCSTMTFMIHRSAGLDPGCVISPLALELESAIVNNISTNWDIWEASRICWRECEIWTQRVCLNLQKDNLYMILEAIKYSLWVLQCTQYKSFVLCSLRVCPWPDPPSFGEKDGWCLDTNFGSCYACFGRVIKTKRHNILPVSITLLNCV